MDNRITKNRLGNFLSYEWIIMIIVVLIAVFLMDGVYAILEVRPTVGQEFKVYYDQNFSQSSYDKLYELIDRNDTLSYDVLKTDYEVIVGGDVDVLGTRLSVYEGDIIVTDSCAPDKSDADPKVRSEYVVDVYSIYRLDALLSDAKAYLKLEKKRIFCRRLYEVFFYADRPLTLN